MNTKKPLLLMEAKRPVDEERMRIHLKRNGFRWCCIAASNRHVWSNDKTGKILYIKY